MELKDKKNNSLKDQEYSFDLKSSDQFELIDLNNLLKIIKRRKRIFIFSSVFSFSIIIFYTALARIFFPIYGGNFKLLINDPVTRQINPYENLGSKPDAVFDYVARNTESIENDIPTLIEYLKSQKILSELKDKFPKNYYSLSKKISVKIVDNSKEFDSPAQVLNIYYENKNPQVGLRILNSLSQTYLNASVKIRQKRLSEGLKFLDLLEPELKENTSKIRNELALFREKNNLLDPNSEAKNLKSRVNSLDIEINKLRSEEQRLKIIKKEVQEGNLFSMGLESKENEGNLSGGSGLIITDSNQSLLKELDELRKLYAEYLTKYLPTSDLVLGIKKKIDFLEPLVLEKQLETINSAIELKRGLINSYENQKLDLNRDFLKQPKYIADYQALENKLNLAQEKERALIKARENFQLETLQQNTSWLILEKPSFDKNPIKPNIFKYLGLGFIISTFFGILLAFIRDKFANVFIDSESVKKYFNNEFLGDIPFYKFNLDKNKSIENKLDHILKYQLSDNNANVDDYKLFFYQETMRNLFINLKSFLAIENFKIISSTSSISGEGKSLINCLIAKTFANNDYKVLLVDADLRNPSLHSKFKLDNKFGLTNFLTEENQNKGKFIKEVNTNLSIITSGPINVDPTKILSSFKMEEFIKNLKNSGDYDLVILDSPPSLGISDYKLINKYTDGIVFVISLDYCKKNICKNAFEEILNSKFNIIGIITNSLKSTIFHNQEKPILNYIKRDDNLIIQRERFMIKNKKIIKLFNRIKKFSKWINE